MSEEITPLEVLELLADGQRRLFEFVKQRMAAGGRRDAACALVQMTLLADAWSTAASAIAQDYVVPDEELCRLVDYANGEREK